MEHFEIDHFKMGHFITFIQAKEWSQKWHESKRNKIIIAEPNFHQSVYRDRRGTVTYLPIDTRMTQGSAKLQMEDWKPKELIISQKMSQQYQKLNEIRYFTFPKYGMSHRE